MEKYNKVKKIIVIIIAILVAIDIFILYKDPTYISSMTSMFLLGYASHNLLNEYSRYKTKGSEVSKMICILDIIIIVVCLYYIIMNFVML